MLDLVGHGAAVDLAERRQRLLQRLARHVDAEQLRGDARLQLRRQRRDQPRLVERRIAERLRAERVEPSGEVAVHPVRLDERHRGGDAAEQGLVDRGPAQAPAAAGAGAAGGCRGGVLGRRPLAPLPRSSFSSSRSRPGCEATSSLSPLSKSSRHSARDRVGILEVVLEQQTGVAGVQAVDVVRTHRLCCSNRDDGGS